LSERNRFIVAVHEVGRHGRRPYFAVDYVEGHSLADLVRAPPLPPARAAGYVKASAQAIHYAHQQGTLHRDLKPGNVLIDRFDQPRVTDFGLTKRLDKDAGLSASGAVVGTPSYVPPSRPPAAAPASARQATSTPWARSSARWHGAIGQVTPPAKREGRDQAILARRDRKLEAARDRRKKGRQAARQAARDGQPANPTTEAATATAVRPGRPRHSARSSGGRSPAVRGRASATVGGLHRRAAARGWH
jgi:hypothetical protein